MSSGFVAMNFNMSQGVNLLSAVVPLLKLISLTMIGLILAHPSVKMVPRATFKLLSKLVFALFLPCLIFTQLGKSITLEGLRTWWFVPVNVLISTLVGCALGYLVAIICKPPPEFFRFTVVMTAFGNTGNLPIAIIGSVCHSTDNPFGPDCHTNGIAYVSVSQWVAVILVYTLVYHMMEPPMEYYDIVDEGMRDEEITPVHDMSRPLLVEAEWPGMEDKETEHSKRPFIATVFNSLSNFSHQSLSDSDVDAPMASGASSPKSVRCLAEPKMVRRIRIVAEQTPVRHILQPRQ
ncbi:hypothetical protein MKW92_053897 [Papaver armeniacum]|nr:hypothetical protein MKW92_053897 [Papaver armeniacum]